MVSTSDFDSDNVGSNPAVSAKCRISLIGKAPVLKIGVGKTIGGSSPSYGAKCICGGIGRHARLRVLCRKVYGFDSHQMHHRKEDIMDNVKTMVVNVLEISTFNQGHFLAQVDKQTYAFRLQNMSEWDKLYDHLMKPMKIDARRISMTYFDVIKIY